VALTLIELNKSTSAQYQTIGNWLDQFISLHGQAFARVAAMALGAIVATNYIMSLESPLWKSNASKVGRPRRSALTISFGMLLVIVGLGLAVILIHMAYYMPAYSGNYASLVRSWYVDAVLAGIVGHSGTAILVYGMFLSKEPKLELGEEKDLLADGPTWQCVLVTVSGIAIVSLSIIYGSIQYNYYQAQGNENLLASLTTQVLLGIGLGSATLFVGVVMLTKRVPGLRFRGGLHPKEPERDRLGD
jgi:hypothetical protein